MGEAPRKVGCCRSTFCPIVVVIIAVLVGFLLKPGQRQREHGHTLDEELAWCPSVVPYLVQQLVHNPITQYQAGHSYVDAIFGARPTPEVMTPDWADDYTVAMYEGIVVSLRVYASRHSDSLKVPKVKGDNVPTFRVGHIYAPNHDVDHPYFVPIEKYMPEWLMDMFFLPAFNCFHGTLRSMPWDDRMVDLEHNHWNTTLANAKGKHKRKVDYMLSFYKPFKTLDGEPIWPQQEYDLGSLFFNNDMWDDGLEKAIAFGLIAAHHVQVAHETFRGESLSYAIKLNDFSKLQVRPYFGRYGADMFFNAEGMPILIRTPSGREVARGDKDWQYWKFVWRCSIITIITLVDHLHFAHFRVANLLSHAVRKSLHPDDPVRRFLSIFTFGSVFVNMNAMHTLIGPRHVLHRSSPFMKFEALSDLVPEMLPPLTEKHKEILHEEEYKKLPPLLQQAPYYQDGRLLFKAIEDLVKGFITLLGDWTCTEDGTILLRDSEPRFRNSMQDLMVIMMQQMQEASYKTSPFIFKNKAFWMEQPMNQTGCGVEELVDHILAGIWTVTGWHRHVGTVGDFYADPELASFSWRHGESFARPLQHMQMMTVAAFTSTNQPKLVEDFSHLFKGLPKEREIIALLENFKVDLKKVHDEIARRNELRLKTWGFKNIHADPEIVECSIAV